MRSEVVDRRRWVTRERFLDLLGATNLLTRSADDARTATGSSAGSAGAIRGGGGGGSEGGLRPPPS
jgi:hypothetical protein